MIDYGYIKIKCCNGIVYMQKKLKKYYSSRNAETFNRNIANIIAIPTIKLLLHPIPNAMNRVLRSTCFEVSMFAARISS